MNIVLIGNGAIARYVIKKLSERGHVIAALLLREERAAEMKGGDTIAVSSVADFPDGVDHVIDCAGHSGLLAHGAAVLAAGYDLTTVSIGALADQDLHDALTKAATQGKAKLHLASGAIGALDCLRAANVGTLQSVRYVGRKPPLGWKGSPAESQLDLDTLTGDAKTHFQGSARNAAVEYPKNANVAAAVALAGVGFDATQVELIADPNVTTNIHEVTAEGEFGSFHFQISGKPLLDNPRSSALAAMSVIAAIDQQVAKITT